MSIFSNPADSNLKCNTLGFNERGLNVAGC